jgi:acetoin utilization deacetylase AcuC-like enzyme
VPDGGGCKQRTTANPPPPQLQLLPSSRVPTDAELALVHPPAYTARLAQICGTIQETTMIDESTYIARGSFGAVAEGLGAALDLADALLEAPAPVPGLALIRPPGHHVMPTRPMGFGLINTVAILARYIQERHGLRRILIVDFDVHHGNGTMEVFWEDAEVMYISTHQVGLGEEDRKKYRLYKGGLGGGPRGHTQRSAANLSRCPTSF